MKIKLILFVLIATLSMNGCVFPLTQVIIDHSPERTSEWEYDKAYSVSSGFALHVKKVSALSGSRYVLASEDILKRSKLNRPQQTVERYLQRGVVPIEVSPETGWVPEKNLSLSSAVLISSDPYKSIIISGSTVTYAVAATSFERKNLLFIPKKAIQGLGIVVVGTLEFVFQPVYWIVAGFVLAFGQDHG